MIGKHSELSMIRELAGLGGGSGRYGAGRAKGARKGFLEIPVRRQRVGTTVELGRCLSR